MIFGVIEFKCWNSWLLPMQLMIRLVEYGIGFCCVLDVPIIGNLVVYTLFMFVVYDRLGCVLSVIQSTLWK